jgi:hypothetical protein
VHHCTEVPEQAELFPVIEQLSAAGSVISALVDAVHPFASVTVTVYVPPPRLLIPDVVAPLLHEYA